MRQYIGARYVPKFMGTYDATQAYEALCVVDNGLGTSYISTVPTPANTPLTDTNYWAIYGASSGAIINLQNQIDDMNDGTVPGSLQNQINTNTSDINTLKTVGVHKLAIITDSYGAHSFPGIDPFTDVIPNISDFVYGTNYCYANYDGAGFVSDGRLYSTAVTNLYNNMPGTLTPSDITDLMILGGCNDSEATPSSIKSAMASAVSDAKTKFPNAKIYIGVIGGFDSNRRNNLATNVLSTYLNCQDCGAIPLYNLQYIMTTTDYFQSDGTHPNQDGMDKIAHGIIEAFNTSYEDFNDPYSGTATLETGFTGTVTETVTVFNDILRLYLSVSLSCNVTGGNLIVSTTNCPYIVGNIYDRQYADVAVNLNGSVVHKMAQITYYNKQLYITVLGVANTDTITAISAAASFLYQRENI